MFLKSYIFDNHCNNKKALMDIGIMESLESFYGDIGDKRRMFNMLFILIAVGFDVDRYNCN